MNIKNSSQDSAKELIKEFGLKEKIEKIVNCSYDNIVHTLNTNVALFCVLLALLFITPKNELFSAPIILIVISSIVTLLSFLLNLWFLSRIKTRTNFFKDQQEKALLKAENNITKTFDLYKKVVNFSLTKRIESYKEGGKTPEEIIDNLKQIGNDYNFLADECIFIPYIIMDLALKETRINVRECFNAPMNEKYPNLKLAIDRLSDRFKNWGLILGIAFIIGAVFVKFIAK